ncbi:hypothetical protein JHW43_001278 [Diplocarpon mali]|nr:hypothetical protein JHW43_001278 [Diplocarpon mali]
MYLEKRPADLVILRLPALRPRAHVLTSSSPTSRSTLADARTSTRPPLLKMTTLASTPRHPDSQPRDQDAGAHQQDRVEQQQQQKTRPDQAKEQKREQRQVEASRTCARGQVSPIGRRVSRAPHT